MTSNPFCDKLFLLLGLMAFAHFAMGQFIVNGAATSLGEDCYQLTPNTVWQSGNILSVAQINLNESFAISGTYNFGSKDLSGADGIVFVFTTENTVLGNDGGNIGFGNVSPSFGWEVDDFLNQEAGDLVEDHMAIMKNGSVFHNSVNNLQGPVALDNIEDGEDRIFCIDWNAETQTFRAGLGDQSIQYTGDIVNEIFGGNPLVHYGFTASTGSLSNTHTVCILPLANDIQEMEDVEICAGEEIMLNADPNALQYLWDSNPTLSNRNIGNPIVSPQETTTYRVSMFYGCEIKEDEVTVTVNLGPDLGFQITSACLGEFNGSMTIENFSPGIFTYSIDDFVTSNEDGVFTDLGEGTYTLSILDESGCQFERTFSIHEFNDIDLELETLKSCGDLESGGLNIKTNLMGLNYSINDQINWGDDVSYDGLSVGDYTLYVQSAQGCLDTIKFEIEEATFPTMFVEVYKAACEGQNDGGAVRIEIEDQYLIGIDDGALSNTKVYENLSPGDHILKVQVEENCILEFPFNVFEVQVPEVEIVTEPACYNQSNGSVVLTLDDPFFELSVQSDQGLEQNPQNLSSGNYIAVASHPFGCDFEFSFFIPELDLSPVMFETDKTCLSASDGSISIINVPQESVILFEGVEYLGNTVLEDLNAGSYTIEVQDSNACITNFTIEVPSFDELQIELPFESGSCFEESVFVSPIVLSSHGDVEFTWNDGSTSDSRLVDQTQTISVTTSDLCDVKTYDLEIVIHNNFSIDKLDFPNIFSPNDDDINDCFQLNISPSLNINSFRHTIFDRWGNKIFDTNDGNSCWDGLFNNKKLEAGVYLFVLEVSMPQCNGNHKIQRKVGDITLIR